MASQLRPWLCIAAYAGLTFCTAVPAGVLDPVPKRAGNGSLAENPPARGAYRVGRAVYRVPALDASDPQVWVHWPEPSFPGETFPMVSYNHGAAGGSIAIFGYAELFEQVASYGIVIAATMSCGFGCSGQGYGEVYAAEQRKVIEWAKETHARPFMDWQRNLDFSHGVGIAGHSMGGESTGINARKEHADALDIRAAVFHMAAILGEADGARISVPSQHMTGTGDGPEARKRIYDGAPGPKVFRNQQGEGHTEPVLLEPIQNPALGPFLAHWMRLYLLGEREPSTSMLFGDGPTSLCRYAEMAECDRVEEGPAAGKPVAVSVSSVTGKIVARHSA